ncbi:hypothetical protein IKQ26_00225 [bacterium]|nr:hypothetical protein [bacterium]
MKRIYLILITIMFLLPSAGAEEVLALSPQPVPSVQTYTVQSIRQMCSRTYKMGSENLFYIFLAALNQYNVKIEEIQSRTGTILFKTNSKEFLVSISNKDSNNSYIKIIPADNNYNFSPVIIQKILSYIDMNNNTKYVNIL